MQRAIFTFYFSVFREKVRRIFETRAARINLLFVSTVSQKQQIMIAREIITMLES